MSGDKAGGYTAASPARLLCTILLVLVLLCGITALILYLIYRPSKPHFSVTGAAIYQLNSANTSSTASPPGTVIATSMQFTLTTRNPNERASVLFDRLSAYVSYRNQPITPAVALPSMFLEKSSVLAVSPVLGSSFVPVSSDVATGLATDEAYGVVGLRLVMLGRMRYKSGPFHSAWTGFYVKCDVLVGFRKGVTGPVPLLGEPDCDVDT